MRSISVLTSGRPEARSAGRAGARRRGRTLRRSGALRSRPPATGEPQAELRTLVDMLRRRAADQPGGVAYVFVPGGQDGPLGGAGELTYGELDWRAQAVAVYLGEALAPGSRVVLAFPQGSDFAGAFFGCLYAGMVAVPVPLPRGVAGAASRVAAAVRGCDPAAVLTPPRWAAAARRLAPGGPRIIGADGCGVGGAATGPLARRWSPLGILPTGEAYLRYVPGAEDVRGDVAFRHVDVLATLVLLAKTARLGLDDEHVGWLAEVHGLEFVWQVLLPVFMGTTAWRPTPGSDLG